MILGRLSGRAARALPQMLPSVAPATEPPINLRDDRRSIFCLLFLLRPTHRRGVDVVDFAGSYAPLALILVLNPLRLNQDHGLRSLTDVPLKSPTLRVASM